MLLITISTIGQKSVDEFLLEHVNHLRDSVGVKRLVSDKTLRQAAEDHVFYIAWKNELTHFQETYRKETPYERVIFFGGNRTYVGENVAFVPPAKKDDPEKNYKIATALFDAWYNSPKHYENMIYPHFTKMGFSHRKSSNGNVYGVQVFSSDQIRLPKEFKNPDFAWGVRPAEFTCKDEPVTYETMFFANSVAQYGDSIYFEFHDIEFFKKVIANDNDGIAIDIVLREQLPCHRENQFHSSVIHDGEMQQPVYKFDLFRNNLSGNPKKILVKIGHAPKYLTSKQWDANVIIINDNKLCDYSVPTEVPSDIIPLIPHRIYHEEDTLSSDSTHQKEVLIGDTFHLELYYERSGEDYAALNMDELVRLSQFQHYIKSVNIQCFASVEGKRWMNDKLLEKRYDIARKLVDQAFPFIREVQIDTAENWSMMYEQIDSLNIKELEGLSKKEVKAYLKNNKTPFFDTLLYQQRATHLYASYDTTLTVRNANDFMLAQRFDSSLSIHSLHWNKLLAEDYIFGNEYLYYELIDSIWTKKELRTNLYGAMTSSRSFNGIDSTLFTQLLADGIDEENSLQLFNFGAFLTNYWFSKFSRSYATKGVAITMEPEELFEASKQLDTTIIDVRDVRLLQINILLSGIHYYVAHNKWDMKNEYFDRIRGLLDEDLLTPQEATDLALFCNHFHKFRLAVDILAPYHDIETLPERGLFVLAKTATLIRNILDPEAYFGYMMSAKKSNQTKYCKWLDKQFQIQRVEELKVDFCSSCQ